MGKREQARVDAAFARGAIGVDGGATDEDVRNESEIERDKAQEQLLRGRTYLGREFLTWLLFRSEAGDALIEHEGTPVSVLFVNRVLLKGLHGEVTELSAKGALAPYSEQVRRALDEGLLVHSARVRLDFGERLFEATLDAEFLDVKSARLPELLTEEEDDRISERLDLAEQLSLMVDSLVERFLAVRTGRAWKAEVASMKEWMRGEAGSTRTLTDRAAAARSPKRAAAQ